MSALYAKRHCIDCTDDWSVLKLNDANPGVPCARR